MATILQTEVKTETKHNLRYSYMIDTLVHTKTQIKQHIISQSFKRICYSTNINEELVTPSIWIPLSHKNYYRFQTSNNIYFSETNCNTVDSTQSSKQLVIIKQKSTLIRYWKMYKTSLITFPAFFTTNRSIALTTVIKN